MYKILYADDEPDMRDLIFHYLTEHDKNMEVTLARNGEEAVGLAYEQVFDLIILDVLMPKMNGLEACHEIRKFHETPILFLSALNNVPDILKGYDSGADDYITKPFPMPVLYKKCLSMIRAYNGTDRNHTLSKKGITLNLDNYTAEVDGQPVKLSKNSFEVLSLLMQHADHAMSREVIMTRLFGYDYDGDQRVVDQYIKRIRRALGDKSSCIKSEFGIGYVFKSE